MKQSSHIELSNMAHWCVYRLKPLISMFFVQLPPPMNTYFSAQSRAQHFKKSKSSIRSVTDFKK